MNSSTIESSALRRHLRSAFEREDWVGVAIELRDAPADPTTIEILVDLCEEFGMPDGEDGEPTWPHLDFLLRFLSSEGGRRVLADHWILSNIPIPRQVILAMPKREAVQAFIDCITHDPWLSENAYTSAFSLSTEVVEEFLSSDRYCQQIVDLLPLPAQVEADQNSAWTEYLRPLAEQARDRLARSKVTG